MVNVNEILFKHISAEASQELLTEGEAKFVDIRDVNSYATSHIDGATRLDNAAIPVFLSDTPKDIPVIVYCYKGISSQQVAQFLALQGFSDVYSMDGGFEAWEKL